MVPVVVNSKPDIADVSTSIACAPLAAQNLTTLVSGYGSLVSPIWYSTAYPGGTVVATPTSVTPTGTTNYYLLSQNSYGCVDTAQVTINIANPQTPNVAPNVIADCGVLTTNLANHQGTPSLPGYTFEWHNANNTTAASLLSSTIVGIGTYYLFEKAPSPSNCYSASDALTVITGYCPFGTVGNYVWLDANRDGINNEPTTAGINGIIVELWNSTTNTLVSSTTTANNGANPGYYNFALGDGNYYIKFPTANGSNTLTTPTLTAGTDNNSDANITTGQSPVFTISVNGTGFAKDNPTIDAGYKQPCNPPCVPITLTKTK
jgi:hypothetical protein